VGFSAKQRRLALEKKVTCFAEDVSLLHSSFTYISFVSNSSLYKKTKQTKNKRNFIVKYLQIHADFHDNFENVFIFKIL
jgi:hypothetical protein